MIPQIRDVILWKRIKTALQKASGYNRYLHLGLLLRDANPTLVLFSGDSFDFHTTAAAATVAWLHNKYVEFLARPASSKVDGGGATLTRIRGRDAPFAILILRLETGFELLKVGAADAQTPRRCGRLKHSVYVICALREHGNA